MNTLKFQNIREKRQECFNVDEYTFNDFDFDGKIYIELKTKNYMGYGLLKRKNF